MADEAHTANAPANASGKKSLKARARDEVGKFALITTYLWVLFAVFSLHRQLLEGHGISVWQQGFAIINAAVFAKIVLVGDAVKLERGKTQRPLAWVVVRKSLFLAILLVAFHIAEEAVRAGFASRPLSDAFADFGHSPAAVAAYGAIFFVVLVPFCAFQEAAHVLGDHTLRDMFFGSRKNRI